MKTIVKFIDCPKNCIKALMLDWEGLNKLKGIKNLSRQHNRITTEKFEILYIDKNNRDNIRGVMMDLVIIQGSTVEEITYLPNIMVSKGKVIK